jgi:hypothetical protein
MDDGTRYGILAAGLVIAVALIMFGAFTLLDCVADLKRKNNEDSVSALTQSDDGNNRTPRKRRGKAQGEEGSETSSLLDESSQIKTDKALLDTFIKVLSQGITLKLHSSKDKGPKEIKLIISGNNLTWKVTSRSILSGFKTPKVDIRSIRSIEWGKRTDTFNLPASLPTADEVCFSLVTDDKTIDIEASSKVERDSLAQGFTIFINSLNTDNTSLIA